MHTVSTSWQSPPAASRRWRPLSGADGSSDEHAAMRRAKAKAKRCMARSFPVPGCGRTEPVAPRWAPVRTMENAPCLLRARDGLFAGLDVVADDAVGTAAHAHDLAVVPLRLDAGLVAADDDVAVALAALLAGLLGRVVGAVLEALRRVGLQAELLDVGAVAGVALEGLRLRLRRAALRVGAAGREGEGQE